MWFGGGAIMTRYDFLEVDEWFWAMLEQTQTLPNVSVGQLSCTFRQIIFRYEFVWSSALKEFPFLSCTYLFCPYIYYTTEGRYYNIQRPLIYEVNQMH